MNTKQETAAAAQQNSQQKVTAWHRMISDACRENRGDLNLIMPLALELQEKLFDALKGYPRGNGVKFRLKLTIEIPKQEGGAE